LCLPGATERLTLYAADLLTGDFDTIFNGCCGVFHTASPFFFQTNDPENDLLRPAIEGTRIVLESCARVESVKKVVLTSSNAAISIGNQKSYFNEDDWSNEEVLRQKGLWYPLSKTLAEKWAWEFYNQNKDKFDLVVVNPCLVLGPMLQPTLNESSKWVLQYLDGTKKKIGSNTLSVVDVREVANTHLLAFEKNVVGRIISLGNVTNWQIAIEILKQITPNTQFPTEFEGDKPKPIVIDNKKSIELGITYRPLEESIRDTVQSLIDFGFFKIPE